jgi:hypothetical protein
MTTRRQKRKSQRECRIAGFAVSVDTSDVAAIVKPQAKVLNRSPSTQQGPRRPGSAKPQSEISRNGAAVDCVVETVGSRFGVGIVAVVPELLSPKILMFLRDSTTLSPAWVFLAVRERQLTRHRTSKPSCRASAPDYRFEPVRVQAIETNRCSNRDDTRDRSRLQRYRNRQTSRVGPGK